MTTKTTTANEIPKPGVIGVGVGWAVSFGRDVDVVVSCDSVWAVAWPGTVVPVGTGVILLLSMTVITGLPEVFEVLVAPLYWISVKLATAGGNTISPSVFILIV